MTVLEYIEKRKNKDSYIGDLCRDLYLDLGINKLKSMTWDGFKATLINKKFLYPITKDAVDYVLRDIRKKKLAQHYQFVS